MRIKSPLPVPPGAEGALIGGASFVLHADFLLVGGVGIEPTVPEGKWFTATLQPSCSPPETKKTAQVSRGGSNRNVVVPLLAARLILLVGQRARAGLGVRTDDENPQHAPKR